jgi:hypothetical protein
VHKRYMTSYTNPIFLFLYLSPCQLSVSFSITFGEGSIKIRIRCPEQKPNNRDAFEKRKEAISTIKSTSNIILLLYFPFVQHVHYLTSI